MSTKMDSPLSSRKRAAMLGVPVVIVLLILAIVGLRSNTQTPSSSHEVRAPMTATPTATRGGAKHVCSSYVPSRLPAGITLRDRTLVPFSDSVLGVDATWTDDDGGRSIEAVDGGYVDDVTEPYDGLRQIGTATVNGLPAEVDTTTLLSREVYVALWRDSRASVPCDVHAVVGLGLTKDDFFAVLESIQARAAVAAK